MRNVLALALAASSVIGSASAQTSDTARIKKAADGLTLRSIGPALLSGRIADLAVHPRDTSVWYVAAGSGGVWKTTNAGTTWTPIFDDQPSYSIGEITLDPTTPEVVWVGTGENVSGRHVGWGDGVYRSRDAGRTWQRMGLAAVGAHRPHPRGPARRQRRARGRRGAALVGGRRSRRLPHDRRRRHLDARAPDRRAHRA